MYEAMNTYIDADTWHTYHPSDDGRFYECLSKIVRNSGFSAEDMGDYLRERRGIDRNNPNHEILEAAIDFRITQAGAIKDFLKYF